MRKFNIRLKTILYLSLISFLTGTFDVVQALSSYNGKLIIPAINKLLPMFIAVGSFLIIALIIIRVQLSPLERCLKQIDSNINVDNKTIKKARRPINLFPKTISILLLSGYTLGSIISNIVDRILGGIRL